ncbi:hypothetical protein M2158_003278 [Streptomyces sp. SAI-144]|uniref:DUF4304 domain-containing protein n=1 Tax=Streptomyces sp. SAI-144 TaxID=2940544 RepID=UPI0024732500|nr:DUF4304 domain-containing protein [Streptomyces sp. SAI-144]MDH6434801.1 hypothetical protein [Streptomyces sp. SAI-144]
MTLQSALAGVISEAVGILGFKRRGGSWYRHSEDLYSIVSIQKSKWDNSCYLNIGFMPDSEIEGPWMPESKCWVRFRFDSLNSVSVDDAQLLAEDASRDSSDSELQSLLVDRVATPVARLFGGVVNLTSLKVALESQIAKRVFVHREMRELLGGLEL